jgi:hypothetical protein
MFNRDDDAWAQIRRVFCRIFCPCPDKRGKRITAYRFKGITFQSEGDRNMLTVKDTDVPGTVTVSIKFKDAKQRPAKVDGIPTWSAADPSIVDNISPAADGMSAELHLTDNVGASQVTVNADVDLGSGTDNRDFVDTVSIIAGDAVAADFVFGTVQPDTP